MTTEDSSILIYAAGTILGILSIGILGSENIFGFSPSLKVLMLLLISLILLIAGSFLDNPLDYTSYIIFLSSFIVALQQALTTFHLSSNIYFAMTFLGAIFLLGVAHIMNEDLIDFSAGYARKGVVVLFLLLMVLVIYDFSGEQPDTTLILHENPHIDAENKLELGEIYAHNRFYFSRIAKMPEYRACMRSENLSFESSVDVRGGKVVPGKSLREFKLNTEFEGYGLDLGEIENMSIVRTEECLRNETGQISIYGANKKVKK